MKKENIWLESKSDGLNLNLEIYIPEDEPKGIVQLSHGMVEDKKYYFDFMEYLTNNGYVTIINDHRGHGKSVKSKEDLGFFYEESSDFIVEDLHQVTQYVKERFPGLKIYLFGHSMGSLIVRKYIKKYDNEINGLIVCGSPSINKLAKMGLWITKLIKFFRGERYRSIALNTLALGSNYINSGISNNKEYVEDFLNDEDCGFIFTTNGFINLMRLMIDTYSKKGWQLKNIDLPIFFIAGENDLVIKNLKMWHKSMNFIKNLGYKNITYKSYPNMKHAILKENNKESVYKDILEFISNV